MTRLMKRTKCCFYISVYVWVTQSQLVCLRGVSRHVFKWTVLHHQADSSTLTKIDIKFHTRNLISIFPKVHVMLLNKPVLNAWSVWTIATVATYVIAVNVSFIHFRYSKTITKLSVLTLNEVKKRESLAIIRRFTVRIIVPSICNLKTKDLSLSLPLSLSCSVWLTDRKAGISWTAHFSYRQLQHVEREKGREGELKYAALDTASVTGACLGIR